MGMRQFEAEILAELRELTGKRKLRQKDIREWGTGKVKCQTDEVVFSLPGTKVNVAVLKTAVE